MNPAIRTDMTPEQYLAFERTSVVKHEYWLGDRYTMIGTIEDRRTIAANVVRALEAGLSRDSFRVAQLRGPKPDDLEIGVVPTNEGDEPIVVIEIAHPLYPHEPRRWRRRDYERSAALREFARIETDYLAAEHLVRSSDEANRWAAYDLGEPDEALHFKAIGVRIPLAAVYVGIEFRDESAIAFLREMSY